MDGPLTLAALRAAYAAGATPREVVRALYDRIDAVSDPGIFIHLAPQEDVARAAEAARRRSDAPLAGIPFAVKDNIDVAGMPTTAACPAFAYRPDADAFVVARLKAAGAVVVGKTNLDQFATGLVGVRTPYAVPRNALDASLVPGGSSSGSAVAVAQGIVPFALGTDTAGSGRVPAAMNGMAGLKPTLGALSKGGVVPACRSLDTISIFAPTSADAFAVLTHAAAFDPADPYSVRVAFRRDAPERPVVGVPAAAEWNEVCDTDVAESFASALGMLEALGARIVEVDFAPFHETAGLLYEGAFLAERLEAAGALLADDPEALHPVTAAVIARGRDFSALDAFLDNHRLAALVRRAEPVLAAVDVLGVPTIPALTSLGEAARDPIDANSRLGLYTNFVNLMDLCALAVPVASQPDGWPGSLTLIGERGRDGLLAALAERLARRGAETHAAASPAGTALPGAVGVTDGAGTLELAVCGAHMLGMALNHELTGRGARLVRSAETTAHYRLIALPGGPPTRPGLVRVAHEGASIEVEVWSLPLAEVGGFLSTIPAPLGIGTLTLADGTSPKGFICEAVALETARDVTPYRSWRKVVEAAAL